MKVFRRFALRLIRLFSPYRNRFFPQKLGFVKADTDSEIVFVHPATGVTIQVSGQLEYTNMTVMHWHVSFAPHITQHKVRTQQDFKNLLMKHPIWLATSRREKIAKMR